MDTERRYLFNKGDSYLFSFDVAHWMTQAGRGWNFGYEPAAKAAKANGEPFDVFNVRGESVVNDREAFVGSVESVVGRHEFRTYSDAAGANGKMLIKARDGVIIETAYYGTNRLQELAQRQLLTATDPHPIEVKLSYWLRFDSTSAKYRWLVQTPCVGFGRGLIKPYKKDGQPIKRDQDGFPEVFTFNTQVDVYALS